MRIKSKRKNISQPEDWWHAFLEEAKRQGRKLSAWIGESCRANLPKHVDKELSNRPPANRPKKVD